MNLKKAGKGFKSLFWVEGEEETAESATPAPVSSPGPSQPSVSIGMGEGGKEDAQIKTTLLDALTKANKPGYDYFEFALAVEEQAKFIPAEETRFQATFAVAKGMGITQASLVADANYYLDILKKEEDKFQTSMDGLTKQNVSSKESELATIDQQTAEKTEQIKRLTEEINQMQKDRTRVTNDISQNKSKIEQLKNNFSATFKVISGRLLGDIEKIKKYIPA